MAKTKDSDYILDSAAAAAFTRAIGAGNAAMVSGKKKSAPASKKPAKAATGRSTGARKGK